METKPLTLGDILKSEADFNSREAIVAPDGTTIGQLVEYPARTGEYLIALSNVEHGKVLVQPHNCVIWLDNVNQADIDAIITGQEDDGTGAMVDVPLTIEVLIEQGDKHGIKYIGEPITSV